jgi:hypothetical protein
VNVDNLSNVREEDSRRFRNKKREYLKDEINNFESNQHEHQRPVFKKGYEHRTNLVKDERSDLLADTHKIWNRWKYYFCQLSKVQGVGGIRQTGMHTARPFVPQPSISEVEATIEQLKSVSQQVLIRFQQT